MPGIDMNAAKQQCSAEQFEEIQKSLAEIVCALHEQTGPAYGRLIPNGIKTCDGWPPFFREVYEPTWSETQKLASLPIKTKKLLVKLHERLDRFIAHGDVPRLVHWDLWASNLLCAPDDSGRWRVCAVLDPICKYAHAEAELAYLDLFHTSTPAFNRLYQQRFKLDEGYHRVRKPIYQLYPLLHHVCTFGSEYLKPAIAMIDRISPLI